MKTKKVCWAGSGRDLLLCWELTGRGAGRMMVVSISSTNASLTKKWSRKLGIFSMLSGSICFVKLEGMLIDGFPVE